MIKIVDRSGARAMTEQRARTLSHAEDEVAPILADVRERGDAALLEYARKFDKFEGASVRIPVQGALEPKMRDAATTAAANIREYARAQLPGEYFSKTEDGRRPIRWAHTFPQACTRCRPPC